MAVKEPVGNKEGTEQSKVSENSVFLGHLEEPIEGKGLEESNGAAIKWHEEHGGIQSQKGQLAAWMLLSEQ